MASSYLKGPSKNDENLATVDSIELSHSVGSDERYGTQYDRKDMYRLGKEQQLRRGFKFMSIFGYAVILGNTWEFALGLIGIALTNGGTAGGIWMFLIVCFGMFSVCLSMAELASMAPTSGGQYHWVSELAPKNQQKFLSYIVGWMCVIGWQAGMAGTSFATTQQLQGLIALNLPDYDIQGWHGTLLCIAITIFAIIWNTVFVRKIPVMEGVAMTLHFFGFFAIVVVLWVMAPRSDPKQVFTNFEDPGGWGSKGVATLVGILGPIVTLIGSDSSCHLAEELNDAARVLPRAMVATALLNYVMGFIMTITIMSTLGNNATALLDTHTGQPWVQALMNATQSRVGTSILSALVCLQFIFCSVNVVTTSSRQLFAFARDKGIPFSRALSYVRPGWDIPVNAILATLCFTTLLSLINIGSTIAFNIIGSLGQVGLLSSYTIVIGCVLAKRLRGEPLLATRFSLGRAGIVVNTIALSFLAVGFTFCFFPTMPKPAPVDMNWTILIFGFLVSFSLVYYYVWGRYHYEGPVTYVKKE